MFSVSVAKAINSEYASTNIIYYKSLPLKNTPPECYLKVENTSFIKKAVQLTTNSNMIPNYVYLNTLDRNYINASVNDKINVSIVEKPSPAKMVYISITTKNKNVPLDTITEQIENTIKTLLTDTVVTMDAWLSFYAPDLLYATITDIVDENKEPMTNAWVNSKTEIAYINTSNKSLHLNLSSIQFDKIGVGGLEKEFKELVQSIFVTRMIPEKLYKKINIQHTKGVILYGPPGCGKTKIARQIGKILGCASIQIINGPELLSKWHGESEQNIRNCFQVAKDRPDVLHLLIFDEFDTITQKRTGGDSSDNKVNNRIVGQLLTMLDGVDKINNLIIFGLTNRLDIIDPAILRPGRFSLHIKIDLPNVQGRYEILKIHSAELIKNGLIDENLDFMVLAEKTENYTGAELESAVQSTVHYVLGSQINFNDIVESASRIENIKITLGDFLVGISKITPMFKTNNAIKSDLKSKIKIDVSNYEPIPSIIESLENRKKPMIYVLAGNQRSGKTSAACHIATTITMPIEYISSSQLISLSDKGKVDYMMDVFGKKQELLIVLDNMELIIEFVSEMIFNRALLQTIKTLLNETHHSVLITTSYYQRLKDMTVFDSVDNTFYLK